MSGQNVSWASDMSLQWGQHVLGEDIKRVASRNVLHVAFQLGSVYRG